MGKLQVTDEEDLVLPQIFLDGQSIGGLQGLQALEDDDKLDKILKRQDKDWKVEEVLPGVMTIDEAIKDHDRAEQHNAPPAKKGAAGDDDDDDDDDYEYGSSSDSD